MRSMTPVTLDWMDTAPVRASRSRRIAQPPSVVWAAIADHATWPTWFTQMKSCTPGPVADAVGGTRTVDIGAAAVEERFLAWEPEQRFAFTLTGSTRPGIRSMAEDIRLTPDGEHACTVTYSMAMDVPGAKLLRAVVEPGMRKVIDGGLAGLATHVGG